MSIMIASDIHGSAAFCSELLRRFTAEKHERLVLLGDILYHGPRNDLPDGYAPKQVIAMLNPLSDKIVCVRGNCDAEVDQMVLKFPIQEGCAPLDAFGLHLLLTHGHHASPENPPKERCNVLLSGHTHVPRKERLNGTWFLNPGSVSIPKENSAHSYMTLDESGFQWKTLEGTTYDTLSLEDAAMPRPDAASLELLSESFSVCKLADVSHASRLKPPYFFSHTDSEISLVCETTAAPENCVSREDGWRAMRVRGVLEFSLLGILAGLTGALAKAGVPVFAVSTYDTDYLLIKQTALERAKHALSTAGYTID